VAFVSWLFESPLSRFPCLHWTGEDEKYEQGGFLFCVTGKDDMIKYKKRHVRQFAGKVG
jgi:hypothetical protein